MNFLHALNIMADSWAWQAAHAAWQAALVGCVAIPFVRLATRMPAQLRYAILLVALAKFAFPPLLSLPTGMFGFVAIAEMQGASGTPMNGPSDNVNNEPAIGSSRQPMDSRERIDGRAAEAQHDTKSPRIVLAHELVHHRRGDLFVNAIQIAIAIVWWFHPVVWILIFANRTLCRQPRSRFALMRASRGSYCTYRRPVSRLKLNSISTVSGEAAPSLGHIVFLISKLNPMFKGSLLWNCRGKLMDFSPPR